MLLFNSTCGVLSMREQSVESRRSNAERSFQRCCVRNYDGGLAVGDEQRLTGVELLLEGFGETLQILLGRYVTNHFSRSS